MKNFGLILSFLFLVMACNSKSDSANLPAQEKLEIEFQKQGELEFLNDEGIPFKKIDIEIADTPNKRANGLMHRSQMDEDKGMLFIFEDNEIGRHTFYMKNTRIPLDIIYLSPDSTVINIAKMAMPGQNSGMGIGFVEPASGDSKFVVEINGGLSDQWGIKEGITKIKWTQQ